MNAPLEEQRALLDLQTVDSAVDRLNHRRGALPEEGKLAELRTALATIDQVTAERDGSLVIIRREQSRLEADVDSLNTKAAAEEARAAAGKVNSPKELTSIQAEVESLRRRVADLEDGLLERMQTRENLEGELAELSRRRAAVVEEQEQVTAARDAALADIDRELQAERERRTVTLPRVSKPLLDLYERIRSRSGGIGAAALSGDTCGGCRMRLSPVELKAVRQRPPEEIKRCEHCRRILVLQ